MAELTSDERTQGMLAHLLNGIFPLIGGLIIWLIGKDKSAFIDTEGKEATNWGITIAIGYVASFILAVVTIGILFFLPFLVGLLCLVFGIIGAIAANKGENYRYPFTFRFIK